MGTYYDRLTAVAQLDYDDADERAQYDAIINLIDSCRKSAAQYRSDPGFEGKAAAAALTWLADFEVRLQAKATVLSVAVQRHDLAREAMLEAKASQSKLSPDLLTTYEANVIARRETVVVHGQQYTGAEYVAKLEAEREAVREAASRKALKQMNEEVRAQRVQIDEPPRREKTPTPSPSPSPRPAPTPKAPHVVTRPPSVGFMPTPITPQPADPIPTPGPSLIEHPIDPLPTPGSSDPGYQPPPVENRDDPRWSPGYQPKPPLGAGAVVGGMIGVGASALAARAANSAMSGGAALAFQSATGPGSASALGGRSGLGAAAGRAPGGGVLSNSAAANAAGTSTRGAAGASARGAAGSAATNSTKAGSGSKSGAQDQGLAGRGGKKKDEKKKTRRHGYVAEALDDDATRAETDIPGAAAGSSADLEPMSELDQGERW